MREVVRASLVRNGYLVIGEAGCLDSVAGLCRAERPSVALVVHPSSRTDVQIEAIAETGCRIVLLASQPSAISARRALDRGASGYLSFQVGEALMVEAIRYADLGGVMVDPWLARSFSSSNEERSRPAVHSGERLSARELELLQGMGQALTTAQLAHRYGLSPKTVENHKTRIFSKLQARNQVHAVSIAMERGILPVRR